MALSDNQVLELVMLTGWPEATIRKQIRYVIPTGTSPERETKLIEIITEADANKLSTTEIATEGVDISPERQREHLAKRACALLELPSWRKSIPGKR